MNITKNVKRITLSILGTAILASGLWACSDDDATAGSNNTTENTINLKPLGAVEISPDINTITLIMDSFKKTLSYAVQQGNANDESLENFLIQNLESNGLEVILTEGSNSGNEMSEDFKNYEKIIASASSYPSHDIYINELTTINPIIINNQKLSKIEKQVLINKIAFIKEFSNWLSYVDQNPDTLLKNNTSYVVNSSKKGWWDSWGKCVVGTVGMAGGGALAGGAVGGAGCTLVLPVIGTVACGTAGAVAGGVFGGMVGAATFC
nr:hypothetical protein [uncultured Flavobacterium sp.]